MNDILNCSTEELWCRLEEQHHELESLREYRREKDASIGYLKTRITTLQNKVQVHVDRQRGHTASEDALRSLVSEQELHISELQASLATAQQEIQKLRQAFNCIQPQSDDAARIWDNEVAGLRASLERKDEELQATLDLSAAETSDLQRLIRVRDEQVRSLEGTIAGLEQEQSLAFRSPNKDAAEIGELVEQNQHLASLLQQASAEITDLQEKLAVKHEAQVVRLENELWAHCRESADRREVQTPEWASPPRWCEVVNNSATAHEDLVRTSGPSSPVSPHRGERVSPRLHDAMRIDLRTSTAVASQDAGQGHPQTGCLRERRDTVSLVEEKIREQIAQHRVSCADEPVDVANDVHRPRLVPLVTTERDAIYIEAVTPRSPGGRGYCWQRPTVTPVTQPWPMSTTDARARSATQATASPPGAERSQPSIVQQSEPNGTVLGIDEHPAIYQGGGTMLSFLDMEGDTMRMAKQQRKLQQMEQRHKNRLSRSGAEETNRRGRPSKGEDATQIPDLGGHSKPTRNLSPVRATSSELRVHSGRGRPKGDDPTHIADLGGHSRPTRNQSPVRANSSEHVLRVHSGNFPSPRTHNICGIAFSREPTENQAPIAYEDRNDTVKQRFIPADDAQISDVGAPSLHDRFSCIRDELKRQRVAEQALQSAKNAEATVAGLMRSSSRPSHAARGNPDTYGDLEPRSL